MVATAEEFDEALKALLEGATKKDLTSIEISGKILHEHVGGYPGRDHRMPMACAALRRAMRSSDSVLPNKLKKDGASFTVHYGLPRH